VLLVIVGHYLNHQIKAKYFHCKNLDYDSIVYVSLEKFIKVGEFDSVLLSKDQIEQLIFKWNNGYPIGPVKFVPTFNLDVKLRTGKIRHFSYVDGCLKENGWGVRFIFNGNFIAKMWGK